MLIGSMFLVAAAAPASSAPAVPNLDTQISSNIVAVADGCGRGFQRNFRGFCVPYRHYGAPYVYSGWYANPYGYPVVRSDWGRPPRWRHW